MPAESRSCSELSGATVVTSAPAAQGPRVGNPRTDDPQFGVLKPFPGGRVGRIVGDGEEVRLGNLMLTAMPRPAIRRARSAGAG